jgi:hypothetical protein
VHCDFDVNECATFAHECHAKAECYNTQGSYRCECPLGFDGDGVEACLDINDCSAAPCAHGRCRDNGVSSYQCTCQDGWTDTNCDADVNECYLKTHDCHADARCVNTPGSFLCRCVAGFKGDGRTVCEDLDDCDPDPCDPQFGTCEDRGANAHVCECVDGYGGPGCRQDVNECVEESHSCSPLADCLNTFGSHDCACHEEFWGNGEMCFPCTECGQGWRGEGSCAEEDRVCVNVNECEELTAECHEHADCRDTDGSYECECRTTGGESQWWGDGHTCRRCDDCGPGYHEVRPCTADQNRECAVNVEDGLYLIETSADGTPQCLVMGGGSDREAVNFYPTRYSWGYAAASSTDRVAGGGGGGGDSTIGNGDDLSFCGIGEWNGQSQMQNVMESGMAVWRLTQIEGDLYTIESNARGDGWRCLAFMRNGLDPYPEPHVWGELGHPWCGYYEEGIAPRDVLLADRAAVWRVVPLGGESEEGNTALPATGKGFSVALESRARGARWECLGFEEHGHGTNPSRMTFGGGNAAEGEDDADAPEINGEALGPDGREEGLYCGAKGLGGVQDPREALLANGLAAWTLRRLSEQQTEYLPDHDQTTGASQRVGGSEPRRVRETEARQRLESERRRREAEGRTGASALRGR